MTEDNRRFAAERQGNRFEQAIRRLEGGLAEHVSSAPPFVIPALLALLFAVVLGVQLLFFPGVFDSAAYWLPWLLFTALPVLALALLLAWRWSAGWQRLAELGEEVRQQNHYDTLTGLPNRYRFEDTLKQTLAEAAQAGQELAVLLIDLDNFRVVNESLGYEAGDDLLRAVAERLKDIVPGRESVCRLGGDEFALLLVPGGQDEARALSASIIQALMRPMQVQERTVHAGSSIGIAFYPRDGTDASTLLRYADTAMYQAKENGKNVCQIYTPDLNLRAVQHFAIENSLRGAIERDELSLYYQPQVDIESRAIVGVEALMRWRSAEFGAFASSDFIAIAERSGLINLLGAWAIETACRQARAWQEAGITGLTVAVNLSARQLHTQDLVTMVSENLQHTGLDPALLELEITESVLVRSEAEIMDKLKALADLGVKLAIDDFGTGYSSLSYIKRLPIHRLKIDKSFVRESHTDPEDAAIARAIIGMALGLGIEVTAEGVENEEQMAFLRQAGCHVVQGYHFGSPLPAEELERLVRQVRESKPA